MRLLEAYASGVFEFICLKTMRRIKNPDLVQLLSQLRFTPKKQRQKQLDAAEKLVAIIDKDKEYPFDFVHFRITGFHPKSRVQQQVIKGNELVDDLQIFIWKLSNQLARPVAEQSLKVYTTEELAAVLNVSTRTIDRWRKRGLTARKFIFTDGVKRLGFWQSTVEKFVRDNPSLAAKARSFTRLTKQEKQQVVGQARRLLANTTMSSHQIIDEIAAKTGRAHETVRYTLRQYDKSHPDKPVFGKADSRMSPGQAVELYKLYKQEVSIPELMKRFNRNRSSIYRIINQRRAKALLASKIEFVASDEFLEEGAREKILAEPLDLQKQPSGMRLESAIGGLGEHLLPEYLQVLKSTAVLNRQRELELFRRYNYLKFLASKGCESIKLSHVSGASLTEIEHHLAEAEDIKRTIIEANLRLVVSIANKHTTSGANLLDLVSEGNVSLMRAVEKYDYTKGYRFGTYASWTIAKDYARKMPAGLGKKGKARAAWLTSIERDLKSATSVDVAAIERAQQSLVRAIRDELDEREQYVIVNHYGLAGSPVKKKTKTLMQIGQELGLSKERVRQIELVALQKLRQCLSSEEFELLTG